MELDYSAIPTRKVDEVAIPVNEAQPSSSTVKQPTLDENWIIIYSVYSMTLYYLFTLSRIVNEKQLPFNTHRVLMITSVFSQFVALACASLIYARKYLQSSMIDRYNTTLGMISLFSAIVGSTSLTFVFFTPQNLIRMGFLVLSWYVVIGVAYYLKKDVWELEVRKVFQPRHETNYSVPVTPLLIMLSLFIIPAQFEWTRLCMPVLAVITFVFCCVSAMKERYARSLEADSLIQPMIQELDESKIVG